MFLILLMHGANMKVDQYLSQFVAVNSVTTFRIDKFGTKQLSD